MVDQPINPRLCKWELRRNGDFDTHYSNNFTNPTQTKILNRLSLMTLFLSLSADMHGSFDRYPLSPKYGLPEVACAREEQPPADAQQKGLLATASQKLSDNPRYPFAPAQSAKGATSSMKSAMDNKFYSITNTILSYPKYTSQGYSGAHSVSRSFPMCGNPDYLVQGSLIMLTGTTEADADRVLSCQRGNSTKGFDSYDMVNMFKMKCELVPVKENQE